VAAKVKASPTDAVLEVSDNVVVVPVGALTACIGSANVAESSSAAALMATARNVENIVTP
jgi:hypothetical protein